MFRTKFITSLLEVVLGLLQPLQPVLHLQINVGFLKMVPNESPYQKPLVWYQNQVSHMIRTQFISSCHDAILGLLQTPHPVRDLQFEMRHLKMVPKHWVWHQNQVFSLFRIIDTISLLAEGLGLPQPSTQFLTFRSVWGYWKWSQMIYPLPSNCSNSSNFTPWGHPSPATVPLHCYWK